MRGNKAIKCAKVIKVWSIVMTSSHPDQAWFTSSSSMGALGFIVFNSKQGSVFQLNIKDDQVIEAY